jgi:hypothetical protein
LLGGRDLLLFAKHLFVEATVCRGCARQCQGLPPGFEFQSIKVMSRQVR